MSLNDFDEISILYDNQDKQLIDYLEKHQNRRTILIVKDYKEFQSAQEWVKLNAIHTRYPEFDFAICFGELKRFEPIDNMLQECFDNLTIPYFTGYLITTFEQLHYMCALKVSEVYIGEDICFDLKRAKAVASNYGVQLRAFPNVAQCSIKQTPPLKKFFIRPEDVEEYADCIDTLEFWGPQDRQNILLKIYNKGCWYGDLNELILDFPLSFDSRRIVPGFAHIRKTCGRKCMKGEQCGVCDRMLNISKKLEENNLLIKHKKMY
jgi:hypothetical protein